MPTLFERIHGIEAATTVANSMGDVTDGLTWQQIEERYGFVDRLLPQPGKWATRPDLPQEWGRDLVYHVHDRPPGMSEDGHERHRLAVTAIIEKGGRVTVEDVARIWLRDIDPAAFGYVLGPQDQVIYHALRAGVWPWETGRYATYPGMIGTAKMMIPIGVVNAGDPDQAARDALDVGRLKDVRGPRDNYSLEVAAAVAAGTAATFRPGASVETVVDAALSRLSRVPRAEVGEGLAWAREVTDWRQLRPLYEERYRGRWMSNAVEVLSSALAVFVLSGGRVADAILWGVNLGRDCDCRAYIAGGWSAGLRGIQEVPEEWVAVVTDALAADPYTVSRRTPLESATGLYAAVRASAADARRRVGFLAELDSAGGS